MLRCFKVIGFTFIFLLGIFSLFAFETVSAQTQARQFTYQPLISGFPQPDVTPGKDFAGYFNQVMTLVIGLTGILAVLMIVIGGIQYVSTDSWNNKDAGKKRIQAAVGGLILALSSYLILNTIDPTLTNLNFAQDLKPVEDIKNMEGGIGVSVPQAPTADYDQDESVHLDPTGQTGGVTSGNLETNSSIDTCAGLQEYRNGGSFAASDKDGVAGSVVGEVAWLMQAVPQKWPGLQVMSSYRAIRRNLESAYHVAPATATKIIEELNASDKSYSARAAIAAKYGIARAALTSRHVTGRAVDFSGSKAESDQLAAWARTSKCLSITEVLWQVSGHYDHVHLGV